jgi:hypothetical protein
LGFHTKLSKNKPVNRLRRTSRSTHSAHPEGQREFYTAVARCQAPAVVFYPF